MILTSWTQFSLFLVGVTSAVILSVPSNVQMGSDFFDSFEYEKAFSYFSKAQKDDDSSIPNLKRLKDYYLIKGETERAMLLQERLVVLKPQNVQYWRDMENLYDWNLRPYEKLRAREREAELLTETAAKSLYMEIAEGYRWLKKYPDANRIYEMLVTYDDPALIDQAIGYYTSTGQAEKSLKLLEKSSKKIANPVYFRWLAEVAEADGKFIEANTYYRKLLSKYLGKEFDEAKLATYDKNQMVKHVYLLQKMNSNLLRAGQMEKSDSLQKDLASAFPDILLFSYDRGYAYIEQKNFTAAYETFRDLETREKDPSKIFNLCQLYTTLLRDDENNRCLLDLLKTHPYNLRYLEALGESFERLGKKAEALKIYERILRLQGEDDQAFIRPVYFELLAQNTQIGTSVRSDATPMYPARAEGYRSKTKLSQKKLDLLRQRAVSLQQELGDGKKSEKLLKKLIKNNPSNPSFHKQLGYLYISQQRRAEGIAEFKTVLKLDPKDNEALLIEAEEAFVSGHSHEAYQILKKLPPSENAFALELEEAVLASLNKTEELTEFCLRHAARSFDLGLRCEYRLGDKKEATSKLERKIGAVPTAVHRTMLINWYLEQERLKEAEIQIEQLRQDKQMTAENEQQLRTLAEVKAYVKSRTEWLASATSSQVFMKGHHFNLASLDILKKLNGPGIGLNTEHLDSHGTFTLISPYAYYGRDWGEVKLGPTFVKGDKNLNSPFFADLSLFGSKSFFFNFHFENSRPEFQLADLLTEDKAYKQIISTFMSIRDEDQYNIDLSVTHNRYTFLQEKGDDLQLYGEALKLNVLDPHLALGARVFNTYLNSDGENIKRLHVRRSLSYYGVIQYANSFLKRRFEQWNYLGKIAIGGDEQRQIHFGSAYNARAQVEYLKDDRRGVRLYVEYYKEAYLALANEMEVLGVNVFTSF